MKKTISTLALACMLTVGLTGCAAIQDTWDSMMGDEARAPVQSVIIS